MIISNVEINLCSLCRDLSGQKSFFSIDNLIIYIDNISKTLAKKLNNNSLRIQIHRLLNLAHKQLKPSIIKNLMLPVILINQQ